MTELNILIDFCTGVNIKLSDLCRDDYDSQNVNETIYEEHPIYSELAEDLIRKLGLNEDEFSPNDFYDDYMLDNLKIELTNEIYHLKQKCYDIEATFTFVDGSQYKTFNKMNPIDKIDQTVKEKAGFAE